MGYSWVVPTDWAAIRKHFPVLSDWVYLNSATFGPVPSVAVQAIDEHFSARDRRASLNFLDWYSRADGIREKIGRLIGCQGADVAFIPSAGVGLSWLLYGMDWKSGDRILTLDEEFPNNLYAPQMLSRLGVEVDRVPGGTRFQPKRLVDAVTPRTRLVLLSAMDYASGLRPPLEQIGEGLADTSAWFVVDGTQGVGAVPVDVETCRIDALICHGYKWLCCPTGSGFMQVREAFRDALHPVAASWRAHREWRSVDDLHHGDADPPSEAGKLEGGIQNFSGLFAMEAVLDLFFSIGRGELLDRVATMTEATRGVLRDVGGEVTHDLHPHFDSPIVTAAFPHVDVSEMAGALRTKGVAVAARHGRLRVSPHFFNDQGDLEALEEAVRGYLRAQSG